MGSSERSDYKLYLKTKAIAGSVLLGVGVIASAGHDELQQNDHPVSGQTTSIVREGEIECTVKPYYVPEDSLMAENEANMELGTPLSNEGEIYGPAVPKELTNTVEIFLAPGNC